MSSDAVFFMQRLVQHVPNFQFVGLSSQQGSHWWPGEDWLQDCAAPRLLALANFVTIGFSAYYKLIYIYIHIDTSTCSTAQGGGGSFQDRQL